MEMVIKELNKNDKMTEAAIEDLRTIAGDKERMVQFRRTLKKRLM